MLLAVSCDANGGDNRKRQVTLTQHNFMAAKLCLLLNPKAAAGRTT